MEIVGDATKAIAKIPAWLAAGMDPLENFPIYVFRALDSSQAFVRFYSLASNEPLTYRLSLNVSW